MGELFIGLAALVGSLASAFVLVWNTVRAGRKPEQAAKSAAEQAAAALLQAVADGDLSREDIEQFRRALEQGQGGDRS